MTLTNASEPLNYNWKSTGGTINGKGSVVMIATENLSEGRYQITASATDARGSTSACTADFAIGKPALDEHHIQTERCLLPDGSKESPGYGLYSYLLMPTQPEPLSNAEKGWKNLLTVVITQVHQTEISKQATVPSSSTASSVPKAQHREAQRLNILYVPVLSLPKPEEAESVDWIVKNYDYARAERILIQVLGAESALRGPYLVANLFPLGPSTARPLSPLSMDLTSFPNDVAVSSVRLFKSETASPRYWERKQLRRFAVYLATLISTTAEYRNWMQADPDAPKTLKSSLSAR